MGWCHWRHEREHFKEERVGNYVMWWREVRSEVDWKVPFGFRRWKVPGTLDKSTWVAGAGSQETGQQSWLELKLPGCQHHCPFCYARSCFILKIPILSHASKTFIWRAVNSRIPQSVNITAPLHHFLFFLWIKQRWLFPFIRNMLHSFGGLC